MSLAFNNRHSNLFSQNDLPARNIFLLLRKIKESRLQVVCAILIQQIVEGSFCDKHRENILVQESPYDIQQVEI